MADEHHRNEDEHVLLQKRAMLSRLPIEGKKWVECYIGRLKLLKNEATGNVRLVMRQLKTDNIYFDRMIVPSMKLQQHYADEEVCLWHMEYSSGGELKGEIFALRFASAESCREYREMVEEIVDSLGKSANASAAADIEKSINDSKQEESKEVDV